MMQEFLDYLRFTGGITAGEVVGWIIAAVGAWIVYKLIDHMQTSIERHGMLHEIEDSFSKVFDSVVAKSYVGDNKEEDYSELKIEDCHDVMVRSVLHDFTPWEVYFDDERKCINKQKVINNQRYILIRSGKWDKNEDKYYYEWISTQALHELTLLCRRIEKMYKDGIIRRIDLSDLFREIIPLGMSGRMEFFKGYYDDYDADCMGYLVMQTIVSCNKCHNNKVVDDFKNYYESNKDIHSHFEESIRTRKIVDAWSIRKFKKLMK